MRGVYFDVEMFLHADVLCECGLRCEVADFHVENRIEFLVRVGQLPYAALQTDAFRRLENESRRIRAAFVGSRVVDVPRAFDRGVEANAIIVTAAVFDRYGPHHGGGVLCAESRCDQQSDQKQNGFPAET